MTEYRINDRLSNGDFHLVGLLSLFSGFVLFQTALIMGITFAIGFYSPALVEVLVQQDLTTDIYQAVFVFSQVISQIPLAVAVLYFGRRIFKNDGIAFKKNLSNNLKIIGLGTLGLFAVIVVVSLIYQALKIDGVSENEELILTLLDGNYFIYMLLATILFAPFIEEMLFRKFMMGTLEEKLKLPKIASILISALLFSLVHVLGGSNIIYIFQYFPLALVICIAYSASGNNIYVAIGIHFINNLIAALFTFLM